MFIKSVTINGMHHVLGKSYNLKKLTYLNGHNGAGKSTVLQAIQFALLGYIPGTAKTPANVYHHACSPIMEVKLVMDDRGQTVTVTRRLGKLKSSVESHVDVDPQSYDLATIIGDLELPIFNFDEFANLTSNKLKDWFIAFLPKSATVVDWKKELEKAVEDVNSPEKSTITKKILDKVATIEEEGVEQVRRLNAILKEEISVEKTLLQRTTGTLQSLIHYDLDGESDVDVISAQISDLQKQLEIAYKYEADVKRNADTKTLMDQYAVYTAENAMSDSKWIELGTQISNLSSQLLDSSDLTEANEALAAAQKTVVDLSSDLKVAQKQANGSGICPFTNQECETAKGQQTSGKKAVTKLEKELAEAQKKVAASQEAVKKINDARSAVSMQIKQLEFQQKEISSAYQMKAQLSTQIVELPEIAPEASVALSQKISMLQDRLQKAAANKAYDEMMDKETKAKFTSELKIQMFNRWVKLTDANGLQTRLMDEPFQKLAEQISNRLHMTFGPDVDAEFNLSEKANSFSFGIKRNGSYIPFDLLSSGEKCLYTLSLMMCIIANSENILSVILVDDLLDHLDSDNISSLFKSLQNVEDIQIIIAGVPEYPLDNKDDVVIMI